MTPRLDSSVQVLFFSRAMLNACAFGTASQKYSLATKAQIFKVNKVRHPRNVRCSQVPENRQQLKLPTCCTLKCVGNHVPPTCSNPSTPEILVSSKVANICAEASLSILVQTWFTYLWTPNHRSQKMPFCS